MAEFKEGAAVWTNYLWFNGKVVAFVRANQIYYIHGDHLGRPEIVTNAAKAIVWKANNFPFDRRVVLDSVGGLSLGLPGQYHDQETNLWYNVNRYYDARLGRYTQSDPLGLAGGLNAYSYVGGDPVNASDPLGLRKLCECEKLALSKYKGYVDLDAVDVTTVPLVPGTNAITFGERIFVNFGRDVPGSAATIALLGHEMEHVAQQRMSPSTFMGNYFGQYLNNWGTGLSNYDAYRSIGYEDQAHNGERLVKDNLTEKGNPCD